MLFYYCPQLICSYIFIPVAFMMGIEWDDCREVAELIGTKTFVNEFVAYLRLAEMVNTGVISVSIFCFVFVFYPCCSKIYGA